MSKEIITLDAFYMGRKEKFQTEWSVDIEENAVILLRRVNSLLNDLGITEAKVYSGWRPAAINAQTPNAAKKSAHMIGKAVDIIDDQNQTLGHLITNNPSLLKKYDLWIEALDSTRGKFTNWVHLDFVNRSDRDSRSFHP